MNIKVEKSKNPDDGFDYVVTNTKTFESVWIIKTIGGWDVVGNVRDPYEPFDVWLDEIDHCENLDDAISAACAAVDDEQF